LEFSLHRFSRAKPNKMGLSSNGSGDFGEQEDGLASF